MKPAGQTARRAARRAAFHAARLAAAPTAKDATAIAWDQVRAQVAKLPVRRQDEAWKTVTRHLAQARKEIAAANSPTPQNSPNS